MPPTPPQLPYLKFDHLDLLRDFPQLAKLSLSPAPATSPVFTPHVPRWCPDVPSLFKTKPKKDLPLFFDLSSLPEPSQALRPAPKRQEVQLWQPSLSAQPTKHSRFFPPRLSSPSPTVRLPTTACVLHKSDKGVQVGLPQKPEDTTRSVDHTQQVVHALEPNIDEQIEASAANLWRILTSNDKPARILEADPYLNSLAVKHSRTPLPSPLALYDTRMKVIGMPAELDSAQVPYIHANSLTGEGNERAEYPQREMEDHQTVIYDSPMALTPTERMYTGLNEMVIDHGVYDEDDGRYWDA